MTVGAERPRRNRTALKALHPVRSGSHAVGSRGGARHGPYDVVYSCTLCTIPLRAIMMSSSSEEPVRWQRSRLVCLGRVTFRFVCEKACYKYIPHRHISFFARYLYMHLQAITHVLRYRTTGALYTTAVTHPYLLQVVLGFCVDATQQTPRLQEEGRKEERKPDHTPKQAHPRRSKP